MLLMSIGVWTIVSCILQYRILVTLRAPGVVLTSETGPAPEGEDSLARPDRRFP